MEYPKMLYKTESETLVVDDSDAEFKARSNGFVDFNDLGKPVKKATKKTNTDEAVDNGTV